nr:MAG TPA: hypothetical protein [Caudoviricetes sp.]
MVSICHHLTSSLNKMIWLRCSKSPPESGLLSF